MMLPIYRIVSVGGVLLAIAILILALIPPGGPRLVTAQRDVGARGPLLDPVQHPEWRQFRIQAAYLRADELERLRRLPDVVIRAPELEAYEAERLDQALDEALGKPHPEPAMPVLAGLPKAAADAEPEDVTGSIGDNPGATMPIDIGATSSTELPPASNENWAPAVRSPAMQVPETENLPLPAARPAAADAAIARPETPKRAVQQRQRRRAVTPAPAAAPTPVPPPFNILAAIFESLASARTTSQTQQQPQPSSRTAAPQATNRQAIASRTVSQ